jgi:ATP-binding protein involved in chromosome partitioning
MNNIKNTILILSGKGGVGKTTFAVNFATSLALSNNKTGLLDTDIHGPNVPKMLNLENNLIYSNENNILTPIKYLENLKVMSIGFMVEKNKSIIWRGPMKHNIIKQFIENVDFGFLDYLVIDFPPGTGDEQISCVQLIKNITGAIIISTPQKVSILDSVRTIDFCKKMNVPIIGIIENMSGELFGEGTIKKIATEHNISFLGTIKMNKEISKSGDFGRPFVLENTKIKNDFEKIKLKIINFCENKTLMEEKNENCNKR